MRQDLLDDRMKFERLLEGLRSSARPEEWPALSSGYRLEIERMQGEILDYLVEGYHQYHRAPLPERDASEVDGRRRSRRLHLQIADVPVVQSQEVAPGVIVDYDDADQVVGIEILHLSKRAYPINLLGCQFQTSPGCCPCAHCASASPSSSWP